MRACTNGISIHTKGGIWMDSEWHAYVGASARIGLMDGRADPPGEVYTVGSQQCKQ